MKKLALILTIILMLSVTSCIGNKNTESADDQSGNVSSEDTEMMQLTFGESIETEMFKFTPSFDGFADEVANWPDENFLTPNGKISGSNPYKAADGKTIMYFSGIVEYIGNSKENESFSIGYIVDYDNGYIFNGNHDYNSSALESEDSRYHTGWGNTVDKSDWDYENHMTFAPLSTVTKRIVRFVIEVPAVLKESNEKSLNVIFTIDGQKYCYKVR